MSTTESGRAMNLDELRGQLASRVAILPLLGAILLGVALSGSRRAVEPEQIALLRPAGISGGVWLLMRNYPRLAPSAHRGLLASSWASCNRRNLAAVQAGPGLCQCHGRLRRRAGHRRPDRQARPWSCVDRPYPALTVALALAASSPIDH